MLANVKYVRNENGPLLGVTSASILDVDGLYFKDLSGTGELLPYEDWRMDARRRAEDLASRMTIEEIVGLMMYSPHQLVPATSHGPFQATYNGKAFEESGMEKWALTDQQKDMLENNHIRHVLSMYLENAEVAAHWNNEMQALAESLPWGIPVNFSSDPRHSASNAGAEYKSGCGDVSKWPDGLGIAASFEPEICRAYGKAVAREYRALGITTALSPQVDLATEPRWMRFEDTFGTHPDMVTELGKIYCDSLQTTENSNDGWGQESVCAMAKHWPGGGPCEGGRDAHYPFGKYAVYPGKRFETHLKPFTEGVFQLQHATGKVSAIMPYYTVSWGQDKVNHQNVGNSYSRYLIQDLLREKYGYDGIVCTDWGITADPAETIDSFGSRCYGVEDKSEAERHLLAIENGVDQFGGNFDKRPILQAYELGCEKYGENAMRKRMEESAVRLLCNIFRCGIFENPYLNPNESAKIVGNESLCEEGYQAQLMSLVLLKNKNKVLPRRDKEKVYIPNRRVKARKNFFRGMDEEKEIVPFSQEIIKQYFDWSDSPEEADFALVYVESPLSDGYREQDVEEGGNGYVPVSLQYRPYFAEYARRESIAGGDIRENFTNRSYYGKWGYAANESDLDLVIDTKKRMGEKPVIVVIRMHNPTVLAELEPFADAILVDFGVQAQAVFDMVSGREQPSALLPIQLPANMETVEKHNEDTPFDMEVYVDELGHQYDFGYGMNWQGVIMDERTTRYPV